MACLSHRQQVPFNISKSLPNITLKRDAPFRGGFGGLLFFRLRWLRLRTVRYIVSHAFASCAG